eukprot:6196333-Pleurochrysis_carterae.AAC.1
MPGADKNLTVPFVSRKPRIPAETEAAAKSPRYDAGSAEPASPLLRAPFSPTRTRAHAFFARDGALPPAALLQPRYIPRTAEAYILTRGVITLPYLTENSYTS